MLPYKGLVRRPILIMSAQRVILVNTSRLLGEMLRRVINKSDHLEMVQEISGDKVFPVAIERSEAEWVILSSEKTFPGWVDRHIARHPSMRFLAISPGSNVVRLKGFDHEVDLEDLSLKDLLSILQDHPQHV
jgi:hypothetical protein